MSSRILLKISGEVLASHKSPFDLSCLQYLLKEVQVPVAKGVELGIVLGGGNLWRGRDQKKFGFFGGNSDSIGMLATVMNAVVTANFFTENGIPSQVLSARTVENVCETFTMTKAEEAFEKGKVVFFAGGTGSPFFTTDSAAALRAIETKCDLVAKATTVEGVYNADPKKNPDAIMYKTLSFNEAIEKNLQIMDTAAFSLCRRNNVPIRVFDGFTAGNITGILQGEERGTLISS